MRLLRLLCFPIARRTGLAPIAVYYMILFGIFVLNVWRRGGIEYAFGFPEDLAQKLPPLVASFAIPAALILFWIIVPIALYYRNREWWRSPRA